MFSGGKKHVWGDHGDSAEEAKATWASWPGGVVKREGPSVAPAECLVVFWV